MCARGAERTRGRIADKKRRSLLAQGAAHVPGGHAGRKEEPHETFYHRWVALGNNLFHFIDHRLADSGGVGEEAAQVKPVKVWHGNHGKVVLQLFDNGSLVKHEKSVHRLTSLGGMGHGIDAYMVDEAISLGAKSLYISEDGQRIVWEAELEKVMPLSVIKNICGIRRRCFDLRHFSIVKGIENAPSWYINRPVEKPKPEQPKVEQLSLFEVSPGELLQYYETGGSRL